MGADDAPACLLTNGSILVAADHPLFNGPTQFFEYNGTTLDPVSNPPGALGNPSFIYSMLMLPNGQVMLVSFSNDVEIYSSVGGPSDAWRPTITTAPAAVASGFDYTITGTQFNGLSQTNAYGDDNSNASNYPLVRITNVATGDVAYAKTHDHSTMGVATGGTSVSTHFLIAPGTETGPSKIEVVANGIPSATKDIYVGAPALASLSPDTAQTGSAAFTLTINGSGFVAGTVVHWTEPDDTETDLTPLTQTTTQITVTVPASVLTQVGTAGVDVTNGPGLNSNGLPFQLTPSNQPPVAHAGTDQLIEATGPTTSFTLDGTASTDPDGDTLTYTWFNSSNVQVGTGSTLTLSRAVGVYTFKLTVSDGSLTNDDTVQITIQDTTVPAFGTLSDITVPPTSVAGAVVTFGPFTANDLVDGAITGTANPVSGSTFAPGTTTVNVSATDVHSNTGHASFHVNVIYSWSGFLSPFPKEQFKRGSNIPIKFQLTGASAGITNLVATGTWATVNGAIIGPEHAIGTFKYGSGIYSLNWKTASNAAKGTYRIFAQFGDGSVHTVDVILK
jgi:hypothetical protein